MKRLISSILAFTICMGIFSSPVSAYIQEEQSKINIENNENVDGELVTKDKYNIVDSDLYDPDVNEDGIIDILDLSFVALHYNQTNASLNWYEKCDINKDKIVDIFDLVIVSKCLEGAEIIKDHAKVKSFTTSLPSGQNVNQKVTLSATSDADKDALYEFSVIGDKDSNWTVIKPYNNISDVEWTPTKTGNHTLRVRTKHINSTVEYDDEVSIVFEVVGNIKDVQLYVGLKGKINLNKTATPMLTVTYDDGNTVSKVPDSLKSNSEILRINECNTVTAIAPGTSTLTATYKGVDYTKEVVVDDVASIKANYDKVLNQEQEPLTDTTMNLEVSADSTKDGIKLNWTDYPIIVKYEIYRKTVRTEYVKIADVTNGEFIDTDVVKNEYYDYKINITRKDGSIQELKEIGILADKIEVTKGKTEKETNNSINSILALNDTSSIIDLTKFRELEIPEFKTYLKYTQKEPFISDGMKDEVFGDDPWGIEKPWIVKQEIDESKNVFVWKMKDSQEFFIEWSNEDLVPYKTDIGDLWIKPSKGIDYKYNLTRIIFDTDSNTFKYFHTSYNAGGSSFAIDSNGDYLEGYNNGDGSYNRVSYTHLKRYVYKYTAPDGSIHQPARFFNEDIEQGEGEKLISINKVDITSEEALQITKGLTVMDPELCPYNEGDNLIIIADNGMPFLAKIYKIPDSNSIDKFKFIAFPYDFDEFQIANQNMNQLETLSTIIDFTPIAGDIKQLVEIIMGKDAITGRELSRLIMLGAIFTPGIADKGIKKLAQNGITKGKPIITNLIKEIPAGSYDEIVQTISHYLKNDIDNISQVVVKTEKVNNGVRCYTRSGDVIDIPNSQLSKVEQIFLTYGIGSIARKSIRVLDEVADSTIVSKVKELRGLLTSKFKRDGNFGYAIADVEGLNKNEYFAHSKIQEFVGELEGRVPDISLKPIKSEFKSLNINPEQIVDGIASYDRIIDTEFKILDELSKKLNGKDVHGKIKLFTELPPCASCDGVILQFLDKYPNIEIEVIHNNGIKLLPSN